MKTNRTPRWKTLSVAALVAVGCCLWSASPAFAQAPPANLSPQLQEVIKLTQAKMSDDVIIQYVKNTSAGYSLTADDILYLNNQGVSQPVISALLSNKGSTPAYTPTAAAPVVAPTSPAPAVAPQVSPYPGAPMPAPAPIVTSGVPTGDVNLSYFQTQLSPYGQWVEIPGQGLSWIPSVQSSVVDWRPYFNAGHWMYTEDGWAWESDYPWGQYAFHYGRWYRDARFGWAWTPGYNWGPAWVAWRNADAVGYCGWAPLPPAARFEVGVGVTWNGAVAVNTDFGLGADAFVFLPYDHFWDRDYIGWRAPMWRGPDLFRASIVVNHYGFIGGRFVFDGIGRDRIALLTHHEVREEHVAFRDAHIEHARAVEHERIAVEHHEVIDHGRAVDHSRDFDHDHHR